MWQKPLRLVGRVGEPNFWTRLLTLFWFSFLLLSGAVTIILAPVLVALVTPEARTLYTTFVLYVFGVVLIVVSLMFMMLALRRQGLHQVESQPVVQRAGQTSSRIASRGVSLHIAVELDPEQLPFRKVILDLIPRGKLPEKSAQPRSPRVNITTNP
ncbi:MAG: hypothetical protein SF029_26905 [bacterium]|nr:hypothetical protein [bacterium]